MHEIDAATSPSPVESRAARGRRNGGGTHSPAPLLPMAREGLHTTRKRHLRMGRQLVWLLLQLENGKDVGYDPIEVRRCARDWLQVTANPVHTEKARRTLLGSSGPAPTRAAVAPEHYRPIAGG